eukprot:166731_1
MSEPNSSAIENFVLDLLSVVPSDPWSIEHVVNGININNYTVSMACIKEIKFRFGSDRDWTELRKHHYLVHLVHLVGTTVFNIIHLLHRSNHELSLLCSGYARECYRGSVTTDILNTMMNIHCSVPFINGLRCDSLDILKHVVRREERFSIRKWIESGLVQSLCATFEAACTLDAKSKILTILQTIAMDYGTDETLNDTLYKYTKAISDHLSRYAQTYHKRTVITPSMYGYIDQEDLVIDAAIIGSLIHNLYSQNKVLVSLSLNIISLSIVVQEVDICSQMIKIFIDLLRSSCAQVMQSSLDVLSTFASRSELRANEWFPDGITNIFMICSSESSYSSECYLFLSRILLRMSQCVSHLSNSDRSLNSNRLFDCFERLLSNNEIRAVKGRILCNICDSVTSLPTPQAVTLLINSNVFMEWCEEETYDYDTFIILSSVLRIFSREFDASLYQNERQQKYVNAGILNKCYQALSSQYGYGLERSICLFLRGVDWFEMNRGLLPLVLKLFKSKYAELAFDVFKMGLYEHKDLMIKTINKFEIDAINELLNLVRRSRMSLCITQFGQTELVRDALRCIVILLDKTAVSWTETQRGLPSSLPGFLIHLEKLLGQNADVKHLIRKINSFLFSPC